MSMKKEEKAANKKFTRLRKTELLELLIEESEKNEALEQRLREAEKKLADRQLRIGEAGTLAEAALGINGLFEAADAVCEQYKLNLQQMCEDQARLNAALAEQLRRQIPQPKPKKASKPEIVKKKPASVKKVAVVKKRSRQTAPANILKFGS